MKCFSSFFLSLLFFGASLSASSEHALRSIDERVANSLAHIESLESVLTQKTYKDLSAGQITRVRDLLSSAKSNLLFASMAALNGEHEGLMQNIEGTLQPLDAVAAGKADVTACIGTLLRAGGALPTAGVTRGNRTLQGAIQKMYYDLALALQTMQVRTRSVAPREGKKVLAITIASVAGAVVTGLLVAGAVALFRSGKKKSDAAANISLVSAQPQTGQPKEKRPVARGNEEEEEKLVSPKPSAAPSIFDGRPKLPESPATNLFVTPQRNGATEQSSFELTEKSNVSVGSQLTFDHPAPSNDSSFDHSRAVYDASYMQNYGAGQKDPGAQLPASLLQQDLLTPLSPILSQDDSIATVAWLGEQGPSENDANPAQDTASSHSDREH